MPFASLPAVKSVTPFGRRGSGGRCAIVELVQWRKWLLGARPEDTTAGQVRGTLFLALVWTLLSAGSLVYGVFGHEQWYAWLNAPASGVLAALSWLRYGALRRHRR